MMPPAAPDPTMAKSTISLVWKRAPCSDCSTSAPPVGVSVVEPERRLESRLVLEAEHVPAGVVAIAAPGRQGERADDGVETCGLEERRVLDLAQQLVLLRRGQRGEAQRPGKLAPG